MVDYSGRIASAEFDGKVAAIRAKLDSFPRDYLPVIDAEDDGILDRMNTVLDHVLVVTSAVLPELVPRQWIDDLSEDLDAISSALDGLEGLDAQTITVALVAALTNAVEETAKELMSWPLQPAEGDWRDAVTQAASTYRRSLGQQLSQVSEDMDGLRHQLEEVRTSLQDADEAHRSALTARAAELEARIVDLAAAIETLDRQRATVDAQLTSSIERADQAIAAQQQQFSDAQERRSTEFRAATSEVVEQAETVIASRQQQADEALAAIQAQVKDAEELVGVFAAAGTANAYSREAKEQGAKADGWRHWAIGLGVVAGVIAATVLIGVSNGDKAWQILIGKLAITVTFGGLAAYAARQSAHHRHREESARHLELNLATFGTLTQELSETDLQTARANLVAAMLQRDSGPDRAEADVLGDAQINIITRLVDAVSKLR